VSICTVRSESRYALRLRYVDLVQACIDVRGHHFFFCIYYFQPVFYLLSMSRGIYNVFLLLIYIAYVLSLLYTCCLLFLQLTLKLLEYGFKEACDSNFEHLL
jgi:hypothetical protein